MGSWAARRARLRGPILRRMRPVRAVLCAVVLAAAGCCSTPPRITDRSTPKAAYETFRGALARDETERELGSLTDGLQERLGIRSRGDWNDMRAVVLRSSHPLVKGIVCSEVVSERSLAPDTAELEVDMPLGYSGRVRMRRLTLLRVWVRPQGRAEAEPWVDVVLPEVTPRVAEDGLVVLVPRDDLAAVRDQLKDMRPGDEITKIEAVQEWFLDDFEAGGQTPEKIQKEADRGKETP